MSNPNDLEMRVEALEEKVAQLIASKQEASPANGESWVDRITGRFADDPDFDEIVRLGAEIRRNMRPETHG